ncbi:MAG: DUF4956 domain-containing protein [Ruminococcus sp.]|nr:DUF4956 domain-containing protein [Ruminococcus sp.]
MSFTDIFSSDMMSRVTAVSVTDMIIGVVLSFLLGMFIFYVYKKTFNGVLYSANFGLSLVGLCMIATVLIMAVSSNVVLSLGMVGALSIVRFRTAIKEPLDIVFLFWAISCGIILATGMIPLAVFGSIIIGVVLLVFANKNIKENPYLLVISLENSDTEDTVIKKVSENTLKSIIKGKTFSKNGTEELTIEIQLKDGESSFVKSINEVDGVNNVVMVSYNGDYMS